MALPLQGLTVVSLEQAVAAPFASRQLADLGARVIKIERESGDFAREYDHTVKGSSSYFVWLNRGKESVVLDLKSDAGIAAIRTLMSTADIFIQNLAPGAVDRLGIGPEDATQANSKLIYISVSGYGQGGSYAEKKAYDLLVQCEAGLLSVTGTPDDVAKVGVSVADIAAGMYAYTGALSAVIERAKTGVGTVIEVSMLEALGEWMMQPFLYAEYGGVQAPRSGAQHASIAPYGPFAARDGAVFFGIQNEREWQKFCEIVMQDSSMAEDQLFNSSSNRVANRPLLHERIDHVLNALTKDEVVSRLDEADIANAELRDMKSFGAHPQLLARDRWEEVGLPGGETARSLVPPVTSSSYRQVMGPVPRLGQHTEAVLAEFGISLR